MLPGPCGPVNAASSRESLPTPSDDGLSKRAILRGFFVVAKLYFEDFKAGDTAEYGDMLVTVEEIKEFATEFDPQPMHLDEEAAKQTMVGGLCALGWHTCGMMMRIVAD